MTRAAAHRSFVILALLACCVFGLSATNIASAKAASCFAGSCTGKSPSATGCETNARTLTEITIYTLRVELRYSDSCNAAWVRVRATNGSNMCNTGAWVQNSLGNVQNAPDSCSAGPVFSNMVTDTTGQYAEACGIWYDTANASACTRAI